MISWFQGLAIGGKLVAIGFQLLGIILVIAWAVFITKKQDAKRLPADTLSQGIENQKKSPARPYEDNKHQKQKGEFRIWHLLGSCLHNVEGKCVRPSADDEGDKCKQATHWVQPKNFGRIRVILRFSESHMRTIVNWLRRRVNQSGKEPCRRRIRHKWRYVETWFFSQHQTKHSSSSFEYATSNCCKAGINPFFSSTGSGTVPKDPPCGNRVTFVSIVQCGGNSSPRALERAVSHGYDAACGRTFYKGLCSWAGQTVLHSW